MYWIHISDIHFNFDGYDTEKMRMELLEYISQENFENLDAIFLTGDLRFAPKKEFKQETKDYIDSLLDSFNPKVPIYISAGNHDLDRSDSRNNMIKGIRKKYKASIGTIDQVDLDLLNTPFKSFNSFIEDSEGKIVKNNNPHRYVNTKKANIICLNTSILSGFSSEDEYGQLIIGIKFLEECLKKTDKNKPTIVYGHHSLESLRYDEHIRVIELLKNYNVHVYLCGHNHIFKINNISYDNNYNLFELFAGNLYTEESNSQCGFLEVKLSENELMIKCHEWDFGNRKWHVSNSYSGEDGLIKRLPIVKKDEIVLPKIKTSPELTSPKIINKVMMFPDEKVAITIPVYKKRAHTNKWPFVHFNEYSYALKLINAISTQNLILETNYNVMYSHSEIHIGGPTVNDNTFQYIQNFIPTFRSYVKKAFAPKNIPKEHQNYIIPSDQTGFSVRDDEGKELLFLRDDKVNDIGLLVRLKINEKKTVHLIFGTGKRGTMAALNYITNYSEEIFLKHNTKNYFLMLWSNYTNYSIDFSKGITDLSEYLHD